MLEAYADAVDAVAAVHIAAAVGAGEGFTCARVVIRIDQRLVITRQVGRCAGWQVGGGGGVALAVDLAVIQSDCEIRACMLMRYVG